MGIQEATSLKEVFQGIVPESMAVVKGEVISAVPLKIQVINDDKLILEKNIICLPAHLREYTTSCDIQLSKGTIDSQTLLDGAHPHGASGTHGGHLSGDGSHAHPDSEGAHVNHLQTFNIWNAVITVHNGLKVGEMVYILSFNQGKKYYNLDREEKTS